MISDIIARRIDSEILKVYDNKSVRFSNFNGQNSKYKSRKRLRKMEIGRTEGRRLRR